MLDKDFLEELSARAAALFPAAENARKKLQAQLFSLLQGSLGHLNLVTREEFEAQVRVLEKASERIGQLEMELHALRTAKENREPAAGE